jgi:Transposase
MLRQSISRWGNGPGPAILGTLTFKRIGLEAGPLSQWLYAAMRQAGLAVELLETRHVRNAFKIMLVKTDRKDARGIAELMRLGWFRPVHCKSMTASFEGRLICLVPSRPKSWQKARWRLPCKCPKLGPHDGFRGRNDEIWR